MFSDASRTEQEFHHFGTNFYKTRQIQIRNATNGPLSVLSKLFPLVVGTGQPEARDDAVSGAYGDGQKEEPYLACEVVQPAAVLEACI